MNLKRVNPRLYNKLLPLLVIPVVFLVTGLCFDFYYDLNDDVVIKDILSGAYLGTPDGHTNQILYPLGWLISTLYRWMPQVPVYGLFLLACYGLCFYLIGYRSLRFYRKLRGKLLLLLLESVIFLSLFLWELVYVQYSVVCGLLAGTACFWFYTTKLELTPGYFWLSALPALFLVWLAFLLRSEMLLLMTPFMGAVGIYHWYEEVQRNRDIYRGVEKTRLCRRIFSRANNQKYLLFVLAAALGCTGLWVLDSFAYRSADWKEYRRFFDARTLVYDYTWYPSYEENQEFYESIGMSEEQYGLIDSYNFALDEKITADTLKRIAAYGERAGQQGGLLPRIKSGIWDMGYRMAASSDSPYNYFVLTAYGLVILLAFLQKDKSYVWKLLLLVLVRSISWMYLLLAGRAVSRITHPLYFAEFLCLLGFLVRELHDRPLWNMESYYRKGAMGLLVGISIISGLFMFPAVKKEQIRRQDVNKTIEELRDYTAAEPDNYYLLDVYSTVAFSEKMFSAHSAEEKNYDILGGWVCHSPLQKRIISEYAGDSEITVSEALLLENFYFVLESAGDASAIIRWYEASGKAVELTEKARVGNGDNPLIIVKISEQGEKDS
ncbi:MAG: hypothetical protein ACI4VG_01695 [Lachnospiraceae bacterium]